jgi:hypothetical protein
VARKALAPSPISSETVRIAVKAYDAGQRHLASWINESLARHNVKLQMKSEAPPDDLILDDCLLALANALEAYRSLTPRMGPTHKLRPWFFYYRDDGSGKVVGEGIWLTRNPCAESVGYTDHQYWRSDVCRFISVKHAQKWREEEFRKYVVEPCENNAREWLEWLRNGRNWHGKVPVAETDRVQLFGPREAPMIDGRKKARLNPAEYRVIYGLVQAGDEGLDLTELTDLASSARKILKGLANSDRHWASVILMAGKPGGRYRIR